MGLIEIANDRPSWARGVLPYHDRGIVMIYLSFFSVPQTAAQSEDKGEVSYARASKNNLAGATRSRGI